MTKEGQNDEEVVRGAFVTLIVRHSFEIRHSDFAIRSSANFWCAQMNDR